MNDERTQARDEAAALPAALPSIEAIYYHRPGATIKAWLDSQAHLLVITPGTADRWLIDVLDVAGGWGHAKAIQIAPPTAGDRDGDWGDEARLDVHDVVDAVLAWAREPRWSTLAEALAVAAPRTPVPGARVGEATIRQGGSWVSLPFQLGDDPYEVTLAASVTAGRTAWDLVLRSSVPLSPQPGRARIGLSDPLCRGRVESAAPDSAWEADLDARAIVAAIRAWLEPRGPVADAEVRPRDDRGSGDARGGWRASVLADGLRVDGTWELDIDLRLVEGVTVPPRTERWLAERLGPGDVARMALAGVGRQRALVRVP